MHDSPLSVRVLAPPDIDALNGFLARHVASSMFLLGNARREGLEYSGRVYSGRYWGAFDGTDSLRGVIAHYWNGNLLFQAPEAPVLIRLVDAVHRETDRQIAGVVGDDGQSRTVLDRLGLTGADFLVNESEGLFDLDLRDLRVPVSATRAPCRVAPAREAGRAVLTDWIRRYEIEALKTPEGPGLDTIATRRTDGFMTGDQAWVLFEADRPVSLSGFNASLPAVVQVGPVWTPPEQRGRGFARHLVAMTLRAARDRGVERSLLYTNTPAAVAAYEAVGFRRIGAYRVALLRDPIAPR
ncbi:MAG: GNAT family N-acetyltransferase [Thalassobaculaceae bacterium]|nr:GNAT family N-acetyltransferase [Thalassobaculaceae bacterium]